MYSTTCILSTISRLTPFFFRYNEAGEEDCEMVDYGGTRGRWCGFNSSTCILSTISPLTFMFFRYNEVGEEVCEMVDY